MVASAFLFATGDYAHACECATIRWPACYQPWKWSGDADSVVFLGTATEVYPKSENVYTNIEKQIEKDLPPPPNDPATGSPSRAAMDRWRAEVKRRVILSVWRSELPSGETRQIETAPSMQGYSLMETRNSEVRFLETWSDLVRARFRVEEVFGGEAGEQFEVFTKHSPCNMSFEAGERYLVYASRSKETGKWTTSSCDGTSSWPGAQDEVMAIRAWKSGQPLAPRIYGYFADYTKRGRAQPSGKPIEGITVRLRGPGVNKAMQTDAGGRFAFDDLEPAAYTVEFASDYWVYALGNLPPSAPADLTKRRCAVGMWPMKQVLATVTGRLRPREGDPPAGKILVRLLPVNGTPEKYLYSTMSHEDGYFRLPEVAPGDYIATVAGKEGPMATPAHRHPVPYTVSYYPGVENEEGALRITVRGAEPVALRDWTVTKRLKIVTAEGTILLPGGVPAAAARVGVRTEGYSTFVPQPGITRADGRFEAAVFEDFRCRIEAAARDPATGQVFSGFVETTGTKDSDLTIRLEPTSDQRVESLFFGIHFGPTFTLPVRP